MGVFIGAGRGMRFRLMLNPTMDSSENTNVVSLGRICNRFRVGVRIAGYARPSVTSH